MNDPLAAAPPATISRDACTALDRADPLAALRDEFVLPEGVTYLDGNSLGALPRRTAARLAEVARHEWGEGLIRSWNTAGWIDLSRRIGDKIAALVGAGEGEISVGDSTSVNCFKALSAAVSLQQTDAPGRTVILSERGNFPTDLYMAESVAASAGLRLRLCAGEGVLEQLSNDVSVLMLTHVDYRSGRVHEMAEVTRAAHAAGALVVWDLAHSAGALPVDLHDADADFAIGCGYKYLNGGPGAPAFVWAHPRHTERMDREQLRQPLSGWLGHAAPFEFASAYRPAPGIARFVCGTPPVLAMAALECGLDVFAVAAERGGMAALRAKSIALTELFIARVEARCAGLGLELVTPRNGGQRGSQVSFAHAAG
ncbi:MAG TPA: kynureninase, partial [Caldimonas sp.]